MGVNTMAWFKKLFGQGENFAENEYAYSGNDLQQIRRTGIQYLYHMTHMSNLPSIWTYGLLSHTEAHERGMINVDISDPHVQDRRSWRSTIDGLPLHDYVCLYFSPRNPMLYRRKDQQHDIILLAIDPCVLLEEETLFTDGNAAAHDTQFYKGTAQLARLPWQIIHAHYWNDYPDGKRIKCAEVLVYSHIDVHNILKIFCYTSQQQAQCQQITQGSIAVQINTSQYF